MDEFLEFSSKLLQAFNTAVGRGADYHKAVAWRIQKAESLRHECRKKKICNISINLLYIADITEQVVYQVSLG